MYGTCGDTQARRPLESIADLRASPYLRRRSWLKEPISSPMFSTEAACISSAEDGGKVELQSSSMSSVPTVVAEQSCDNGASAGSEEAAPIGRRELRRGGAELLNAFMAFSIAALLPEALSSLDLISMRLAPFMMPHSSDHLRQSALAIIGLPSEPMCSFS